MIVRILGEGQFNVPEEVVESLNALDAQVEHAIAASDEAAMQSALEAILERVRAEGSPVPDDLLADSDLILPDASVGLDEIKAFLDDQSTGEGLIPG